MTLKIKTLPDWLQTLYLESVIKQALENRFTTNCLQALRDDSYEYANFCYANDIKQKSSKRHTHFLEGSNPSEHLALTEVYLKARHPSWLKSPKKTGWDLVKTGGSIE